MEEGIFSCAPESSEKEDKTIAECESRVRFSVGHQSLAIEKYGRIMQNAYVWIDLSKISLIYSFVYRVGQTSLS